MAMSRKLYVRFSKLVENGGGANGGKPWLIDPENVDLLCVDFKTWKIHLDFATQARRVQKARMKANSSAIQKL